MSRRHVIGLLGFAVGAAACGSNNTPAAIEPSPTPSSAQSDATTINDSTTTAADPQLANGSTASVAESVTPASTPEPLALTLSCEDDDELTLSRTEGPYFSSGSPERKSLREANDSGVPFVLSGVVTDTTCAPVANAKIELWHAGPDGEYDNSGYRYRGHFFTAANGTFSVDTVKAGLYPGRTRHFHVMVQPANGALLTSQLFWPDEAGNASDNIFDESLLMAITTNGTTETGTFQFVV